MASGRPGIVIGNHQAQTVGIDEQLVAVKTQSLIGGVASQGAISVDLTGLEPRNHDVPVMVAAVVEPIEGDDPSRLRGASTVEEQQLQTPGVSGKDAEVDSPAH